MKARFVRKNKIPILHHLRFLYGFLRCKIQTKRLAETKNSSNGLNKDVRDTKIIVSLTSYPARILYVHKAIRTILNQTVQPDYVYLNLAVEQFPNLEDELPEDLIELTKFGLKINWYHNIRSYKKLIPIYDLHHNDIIVTADDDILYNRNWIELLMAGYKRYPDCIQANVSQVIYLDGDTVYIDQDLRHYHRKPSYSNCLIGYGGVLYPPNCLNKMVTDEKTFTTLAPTNDDLWFWAMACLNNTKVNIVKGREAWAKVIPGLSAGLARENSIYEIDGPFVTQLLSLIKEFPQVGLKIKKQ